MHLLIQWAVVLLVLYGVLYYLYSVQYLGLPSLYGSPITKLLFPGHRTMAPIWGSDAFGMLPSNSQQGIGRFWPDTVPYAPSKSGSGGPQPNGGMREAGKGQPVQLRDGYTPLPLIRDVYDHHVGIPAPMTQSVGWWGQ